MVQVIVKWNKLVYNVDLDPQLGVSHFKSSIQRLTHVPPERQKLMAKGAWMGILKDEVNLSDCKISDGLVITLMGTAEVVAPPVAPTKFIEDMTLEEQAKQGAVAPAGFTNMGNTCYMNSMLQCLRYIPDLREALKSVPLPASLASAPQGQGTEVDPKLLLPIALRYVLDNVDRSGQRFAPAGFINALRAAFPQFAEQDHGRYMQQDADELYGALTSSVLAAIRERSLFTTVIGLEMEQTLTCQEASGEAPVTNRETVFKLICNIQGGAGSTINIDHMQDGIRLGLEGTIEKFSSVLNRDALWKRTQRIASLPQVICVQFMRFFWKPTPESRDHAGLKCKILRAVSFPDTLDIFQFCSEGLQANLLAARKREDEKHPLASKKAKVEESSTSADAASVDVGMEVDEEEAEALRQALALSLGSAEASSTSDNFTGFYELNSVLTHKGRSADSGHYMSYVRQEPRSNLWWKFDDDTVSETTSEEVMRLNGGGDRDMAYLCFYSKKN